MKRLTIEELQNKDTYKLKELLNELHDIYENGAENKLEVSSFIQDVEFVLAQKKYYALYDLQLDGFKAGYASERYNEIVRDGAMRAWELSQSDEVPCPDDIDDEEVLDLYDYEVREVTFEEYDTILNSDNIGLMKIVEGV